MVTAIPDFTIFAESLDYSLKDVTASKALLVDTVDGEGRRFELMFEVSFDKDKKNSTVFYFIAESYEFKSDRLKITFPEFTISSYDIGKDDLKSVVKLTLINTSEDEKLGQFSSLVRFDAPKVAE